MDIPALKKRVRYLLLFFVAAVLVSGVTAFPLEWELSVLSRVVSNPPLPGLWPDLAIWINRVYTGLHDTYRQYPFIAYGTDWLAFAHIVIAIVFWGPLRDPVKNIWVVEFGMIACGLVVPLALICGPLRGIPFFWRLIDCSFGILGFIPLWMARKDIQRIVALEKFVGPSM
ncbi:MAG: hypothetical protein A2W37_06785 [Chloroflexi bacterium RBG_16_63_12]|nr:MAG: hypothetical protein A2W37_06785 [Chloroflexi bacterium RBG_16_63_12]